MARPSTPLLSRELVLRAALDLLDRTGNSGCPSSPASWT